MLENGKVFIIGRGKNTGMFQFVGVVVVTIFALFGAYSLGWLPENWAPPLSSSEGGGTDVGLPTAALGTLPSAEKTFTERVTGERSPQRP